MKTFMLCMLGVMLSVNLLAQDRKPGQKPATTRPLTIKSNLPTATRGTGTAPATQPTQPATPPQQPVGDFPDLRITALTVTATAAGPDVINLVINYTIRNDGKIAARLANVNLQGYTATEANMNVALPSHLYAAGCGIAAGIGEEMLEPGKEIRGSFRCSNRILSIPTRPVYQLTVNQPASFQELNLANNAEISYILF